VNRGLERAAIGPTSTRSAWQGAFDWALGATLFGWALQDWLAGRGATLVGAAILSINALVGVLFLARREPRRRAAWWESALCLASVPVSGVALALAPMPALWPWPAKLGFVVATAAAAASLACMGSAFGVLPAFRRLVRRGPFRLVRHPVYGCELAMVLCCALASEGARRWLPLAAAVMLVLLRIGVEESVLLRESEYRRYAQQVRWRLFPGLW
jgi:protein-S-isoprenylcysteine O-methyltransferase Ste14